MKKEKKETACGHCGEDIKEIAQRCKCRNCGYINFWHDNHYKAYTPGIHGSAGVKLI